MPDETLTQPPSFIRQVINGFLALSANVRIIIVLGIALVVVLLVLWASNAWSTHRANKKTTQMLVNANSYLANVATINANIAAQQIQQTQQLAAANQSVQQFNDAVNASESDRVAANKALEAVNAARNANEANVSVQQLEDKLDQLDRQQQ